MHIVSGSTHALQGKDNAFSVSVGDGFEWKP